MTVARAPFLVDFQQIGDPSQGFIGVAALRQAIPFEVRRVFWTWATPSHVVRGRHAHHRSEIVLIAVAGRIVVTTELPSGQRQEFELESPTRGLYLPPHCWRTMTYSQGAVQLAFASTDYSADDYVRSHAAFQRLATTPE